MTTTIGIIGLGQIGGSIGLALKGRGGPERIVGHDRDAGASRTAESMGAVDTSTSLKGAVKGSDLLFLCLPLSEMREALERMDGDLKENAILIDTAPIKRQLKRWLEEFLPPNRYHIGVVPALNPSVLAGIEAGIKAARAELFHRSTMIVVTSPGTPEAIEELGMNIARLLGAKPMLADLAESDGIMTTAHLMPQLAAAALIESCAGDGGWLEAKKLAGRPFTTVSGGMAYFDDPRSVEVQARSNPERVVHSLDVLIASLQGIRDDINRADSERVAERLQHGHRTREQWLDERNDARWLAEGQEPVKLPGLAEHLTQMFFGGRIARATRVLEGKQKGTGT